MTDPKQKRFFTRRDMKDLFSLDEAKNGESETARVFRDVAHEVYAADTVAEEGAEHKADNQPTTDEEKETGGDPNSDRAKRKRLNKSRDSGSSGDVLPFDVEPFKEEEDAAPSSAGLPSSSSSASSSPAADRLLSLLFSKGGITSAMSHDSIMEGSSRAEKAIAETVAKKVAERAVEALKKSREQMRGQPLSVPTWTGRNGYQPPAAGAASGERKRFGTVTRPGLGEVKKVREGKDGERMRSYDDPSSSSTNKLFDHHTSGFSRTPDASSSSASSSSLSSSAVLARLKQRSEQGHVAVSAGLPSAQSMASIEERDARQAFNSPAVTGLLDELCAYLDDRREGVTTQALVDAFAGRLAGDQDKFVFRQLLRSVAQLDKSRRGEGKWKLKREAA